MLRALVFDFDGLVIDTESPELEVWREIYEAHGQRLTLDLWSDRIGRPMGSFDPCAHLAALCGEPLDCDTIRAGARQRVRSRTAGQKLLPGVQDWLDDARRKGLRIGIASSSSHPWVERHLERLGVRDRFEKIVCREDTIDHKPLPAPYQRVVGLLGVVPAEALALEDSPHGIASAKAAGLWVVAVPNIVTRLLALHGEDLRLESLAEMSLAEVAKRLKIED